MNDEQMQALNITIPKCRIGYVDIAKCIGMGFVIHNHLGLNYNNGFLKIFFASFHMPLFFFLSGFVRDDEEQKSSLCRYIMMKFTKIVIPYYLWSFIFSDFNIKTCLLIIYGSNRSISMAGGVGGSWFLPCFFLADVLYRTIKRVLKNNTVYECIATAFLLFGGWCVSRIYSPIGFFMSFDVALCGAGFIFAGNILRKANLHKILIGLNAWKKIILLMASLLITFTFAVLNKTSYDNEYMRPVMALGYYGNYLMFLITALFGTITTMIIAVIIERIPISDYFQRIGRNTFSILLVQQICIIYFEKITGKIALFLNPIGALIVSFAILVISYSLARVITYIAPNLNGKYLFIK